MIKIGVLLTINISIEKLKHYSKLATVVHHLCRHISDFG
jgi:hypothetical protein